MKIHITTVHIHTGIHNNYFLIGIILKRTFLMSWLNSFQHSEISRPFSRFMMLSVTSFWGLRQSINKASFYFPPSPMGFRIQKLPVFPIDGLHNMLSNTICFGVVFDCIFVLVFARRKPLLGSSQVNLWARFTSNAINNIFPHIFRAWRFEPAKCVV